MPTLMLVKNTPTRLVDLLNIPEALVAALAGAGAGNVDNGDHYYLVVFKNAQGKSAVGSVGAKVTVADKTVNGKVALSQIPIGPPGTTAREIYRTKVASATVFYLQSTIANNSATTLTDNTADAGLGAQPVNADTRSAPLKHAGFFTHLYITVNQGSANTVPIYVDQQNPNISDTDFGHKLEAGGINSVLLRGPKDSALAAGDVWLYTTADNQTFQINGQEV